ncbi:GGDEF domain-containing protein [Adhaeretor mobilis]|uniref:diguanylate cyclase n=1 Tax=Adhaeretor mobilis TaxID=1930276 RepID=A0A517MYK2_9BACT|nr:diguanylate cyclase [Adhaeretor mobilis]QDS99968.1 Response regulator PleD [Adhaeretor mobilis]
MLLGIAFTSVLIDVGLSLIAVVVGFLGAYFYLQHTAHANLKEGVSDLTEAEQAQAENDAERASMAVDQVRDLTRAVASDVTEHSSVIEGISNQLNAIDQTSKDSSLAIANAIAQMLGANGQLQARLEEAEQKIKNQAEELRTQETEARTDSLTKLANRRAFDHSLEHNLEKFCKERVPFAMILLDVDHFKKFNDTHGHQAGDEVLRVVGRTLNDVVKKTDLPCRYGGEEFAIVLPSTNAQQGRVAAERVRKAIEAATVPFEGKNLKVTASVGLTEVARGDQTDQIIRRADDAVYAAKDNGRNRSYWQDGLECLPIVKGGGQLHSTQSTKKTATVNSGSLASLTDSDAFVDELSRRVAENNRYGVSLSVMHLQICDFAEHQAKFGEAVGELLIESVGGYIRSTLREMDLLGDLSNGHFTIMLPGSGEHEAKLVGKRIQTAISNCVIPMGKNPLRLEMNLGVAVVEPDDDAVSLLDRARELMERTAKGLPIDVYEQVAARV